MIEDLDDVRAAELSRGLRLALEPRVGLGDVRHRDVHELHGADGVQPDVAGLPDRAHAAATDHPRELEPLGDDHVFCEDHPAGPPRRMSLGGRFSLTVTKPARKQPERMTPDRHP
jgi:hypothetical protein